MSGGSPVEKVIVARLGLEGGGVTIFGRVVEGPLVFWQAGTSIAMDADDNEEWREWESDSSINLSAVVPGNWPLMSPREIHPAFVPWFRRHYDAARASLRDDLRAYQAGSRDREWRRVFGEAARARDEASKSGSRDSQRRRVFGEDT
jgi:hypothetical protein